MIGRTTGTSRWDRIPASLSPNLCHHVTRVHLHPSTVRKRRPRVRVRHVTGAHRLAKDSVGAQTRRVLFPSCHHPRFNSITLPSIASASTMVSSELLPLPRTTPTCSAGNHRLVAAPGRRRDVQGRLPLRFRLLAPRSRLLVPYWSRRPNLAAGERSLALRLLAD